LVLESLSFGMAAVLEQGDEAEKSYANRILEQTWIDEN
jgi:hypothetical protein